MCNECNVPLLKLWDAEKSNLSRSQKMKAHPNPAVIQLEPPAHALRRAAL
jgi:hypothetical protein